MPLASLHVNDILKVRIGQTSLNVLRLPLKRFSQQVRTVVVRGMILMFGPEDFSAKLLLEVSISSAVRRRR